MKQILFILFICNLFLQCSNSTKKQSEHNETTYTSIDFGELQSSVKMSDVVADWSFVKLETADECLLDVIRQIRVFDNKIYVLDDHNLYEFAMDGKFIKKFQRLGNGPGEFIVPQYFQIDADGFILVLDTHLRRLLKYNIEDFSFVEAIIPPTYSQLAFSKMPGSDLYVYYCGAGMVADTITRNIVIADKSGIIKNTLFDMPPSSKITFLNPTYIYDYDNNINVSPALTGKIYSVTPDSLHCRYQLSFGQYKMMDENIYSINDIDEISKKLFQGNEDWISYQYTYETHEELFVRYFVKSRMYIGIWNKQTSRIHHFEWDKIIDDLGFGGVYPYPMGVADNQFIGDINPSKINTSLLSNEKLKNLMVNLGEEDNPILVFYAVP